MQIYDQDYINTLTNYILNSEELRKIASIEDWGELYAKLMQGDTSKIPENIRPLRDRFLYKYFLELADFNIFSVKTKINPYTFAGDKELTSIEIPNTVEKIELMAFPDCSNLKKVTFEENSKLDFIGMRAFLRCTSLESIELPDKLHYISREAFGGCDSLETIVIPNSIMWLQDNIFDFCTNLNKIIYKGTKSEWKKISGELMANPWDNVSNVIIQCNDGAIEI